MASRSRCQGWILGERAGPTCAGPLLVGLVAALLGIMVGLLPVGCPQTPGEQPADEACELLPLALGELVPERRGRRGQDRPSQGRGGSGPDVCLRMGKLLGVGCAA